MPTDPAAFTRQLRDLRQTRQFTADPVPAEALRDILEVARWTGSAKNTQPWHLIVVDDPAVLRELSTLGQYAGFLEGVPLAIVVAMEGGGSRTVAYDEGRLSERIMLAADAHGLGSGTAWFAPGPDGEERARALLGVPEGLTIRQAIALGIPRDADQRARSVHGGRRPLAEIVSWGRFGEVMG